MWGERKLLKAKAPLSLRQMWWCKEMYAEIDFS